jgi:hypothetical protein
MNDAISSRSPPRVQTNQTEDTATALAAGLSGQRQRAAELGLKIQAEDGISNAVEIIQQIDGN